MASQSGEIANVKYLWKKVNQLMGTNYNYPSEQAINIEYVFKVANKLDDEGLQTEPNFESQMNENNKYQVVDSNFTNKVINCVNSCARSCHSCTGTCFGGCGVACGGCTGCREQCSGCTNACTGARK